MKTLRREILPIMLGLALLSTVIISGVKGNVILGTVSYTFFVVCLARIVFRVR